MGIANTIFQKFKAAAEDREHLLIWIGRRECSVLDQRENGGCYPISNSMAHRFIQRAKLIEIDRRADGICYGIAA